MPDSALKRALRQGPIGPLYLWLARCRRNLRRLFIYPETARVGAKDPDLYWEGRGRRTAEQLSAWRLKRARLFTRLVADGDRVLELGTGDGALLRYLLNHRRIEARGIDIAPETVAFCRAQGLDVTLGDIRRPVSEFVNEPVDYVILSEIIEHLPDPEGLLQDLRPLVRKGFLLSIPNTGYHQHRLRLLLGRFPLQWEVTPGEHLRFWTRTDFHWWARQLGLEIRREIPYEGTPVLKDLWPSLFAAAFVFVLGEPAGKRGLSPTDPRS